MNDNVPYSELLSAFLDNEVDGVDTSGLFYALAHSSDLQNEFRQLVALRTAMSGALLAPPSHMAPRILEATGLAAPVVPPMTPASLASRIVRLFGNRFAQIFVSVGASVGIMLMLQNGMNRDTREPAATPASAAQTSATATAVPAAPAPVSPATGHDGINGAQATGGSPADRSSADGLLAAASGTTAADGGAAKLPAADVRATSVNSSSRSNGANAVRPEMTVPPARSSSVASAPVESRRLDGVRRPVSAPRVRRTIASQYDAERSRSNAEDRRTDVAADVRSPEGETPELRAVAPRVLDGRQMIADRDASGHDETVQAAMTHPQQSVVIPDDAPDVEAQRWSVSPRVMTSLWSSEVTALPPLSTPLVNNVALQALYRIDDHYAIGLETGQEPLVQVYSGVEQGRTVHIEQNYLAPWAGISYRYVADRIELAGGITPFASVTGGATRIGPMARATVGLRRDVGPLALFVGTEFAGFAYRYQGQWFSTSKVGLTYGASVTF